MKISFDFDETLSELYFQKLAKALVIAGVDVYIVTSRCNRLDIFGKPVGNIDLWAVAKYVGITEDKVFFTEGAFKADTLSKLSMDIHFDDMSDEIYTIQLMTKCKGVNLK